MENSTNEYTRERRIEKNVYYVAIWLAKESKIEREEIREGKNAVILSTSNLHRLESYSPIIVNAARMPTTELDYVQNK